MANVKAKMMPHSIEAEQSVLCSLLIDENSSIYIMSKLKVADFYLESHQEIYQAMVDNYLKDVAVDYITVSKVLDQKAELEEVGGLDYITDLTNFVPSAANYKHYADIVKNDSILRQIIEASQQTINKAFESVDVIALPTAPNTAFKFGEKSSNPVEMYLEDIFTVPVNVAGLPGISVPCGFDSKNLPIGLQFIAKAFDEQTLLNVAYAYEQNTTHHEIKPNV